MKQFQCFCEHFHQITDTHTPLIDFYFQLENRKLPSDKLKFKEFFRMRINKENSLFCKRFFQFLFYNNSISILRFDTIIF